MHGRAFGSLEVVMHFAFLVFMLATAKASHYVGKAAILTCIGGLFAFWGIAGLARRNN
jgi:hypothetical protein